LLLSDPFNTLSDKSGVNFTKQDVARPLLVMFWH